MNNNFEQTSEQSSEPSNKHNQLDQSVQTNKNNELSELSELTNDDQERLKIFNEIQNLLHNSTLDQTTLINVVSLLATDLYQITMAYGYWKMGMQEYNSVFDMYFRKAPFKGEFAVFAGIDKIVDVLKYVRFSENDIKIVKNIFTKKNIPIDEEFYSYLLQLDFSKISVQSVRHGEIVFPGVPVMKVSGPIIICQLLETLFLSLVSFPTLVATNATRMVIYAKNKLCIEYGLRRAQGIGAANDATKYSQIGGFVGTSNVLEGYKNDIYLSGTLAHAYVTSFDNLDCINDDIILKNSKLQIPFKTLVLDVRRQLNFEDTIESELASFIAYAIAFPTNFFGLLDTFKTLESGVKNYICVAVAIHKCGFKPVGVRIDSGDLGYLSSKIRKQFVAVDSFFNEDILKNNVIVASNEISEEVILSLNDQSENEIDTYAIGTKLVTCAGTPALGMVYKLAELNRIPKMKFSQVAEKITLPCDKNIFRFYNSNGIVVLDFMTRESNINKFIDQNGNILCKHPVDYTKQGYFNVHNGTIKPLLHYIWKEGKITTEDVSIQEATRYNTEVLKTIRPDVLRHTNPTPAKVSVDAEFFEYIRNRIESNLRTQII